MMSMQLKITNIHAQIGINRNDAVLSIRQPTAEMEINTQPGKLNIRTELPQVVIDQSQCFSEVGLKSPSELTADYAQRGMSAAMEAIGTYVDEGNRMAQIESGENAIAGIAADKAFPPPDEYNITFVPKSRPKIEFTGSISFNSEPARVDIKVIPHNPEINATYLSMEFYMLRKPLFRFEFVGGNVDVTV